MNETSFDNKNLQHDLMFFLKVMETAFLQQDNAIFYHYKSVKQLLDFYGLNNLNGLNGFDLYARLISLVL